jgi:hypothetical protein
METRIRPRVRHSTKESDIPIYRLIDEIQDTARSFGWNLSRWETQNWNADIGHLIIYAVHSGPRAPHFQDQINVLCRVTFSQPEGTTTQGRAYQTLKCLQAKLQYYKEH